jgi:exosortase E/protease (VPEID-CTERM system)
VGFERGVPAVLIATIAIAALFSRDTLRENLPRVIEESPPGGRGTRLALGAHLGCLAGLALWIAIGAQLVPAWMPWPVWIWARLALEMAVLASWIAMLLPSAFWLRWFRDAPMAFAVGFVASVGAKAVTHMTDALWAFCRESTFHTVGGILHLLGEAVVVVPAHSGIGTRAFSVEIAPGCSGLDGIAITCVLVGIYLWIYRRELKFPLALVLLPAGIALSWTLNAARIVVLILIGNWSPRLALDGFHSVAGWLSLSFVSYGLIVASLHIPALRKSHSRSVARSSTNSAGVYLAPLFAIVATAMVTRAIHPGFDLLYPARVIVAAAILWYYRRELTRFETALSALALAAGIVVFVLWVLISPAKDAGLNGAFASALGGMPPLARDTWLLFRIAGATITAPIAEELAFRGYLMRKLVAADFEAVPFGTFTWLSFVGSSVSFGALHGQLIAGTIAGMFFAAVLCRRGVISDAIVAHAAANALLSAYVLFTHDWWLWT